MKAVPALVLALTAAAWACAGVASAQAPSAVEKLAARYAPVVFLSEQETPCGNGEPFQPIDVDALFGNDEVALRGPWRNAGVVKVAPRASDIASGRYGYSLDFPGDALSSSVCSYEEWERRIMEGHKPTVYAHVATEEGKLALQYWFFYVYNDFNNKHEGDWEMIQLNFDVPTAAKALQTHPYELGYSQHEGSERAEWGASKLELVDGTHPVVYPAEGSHANYYSGALFLGRSAAQGVGCDDTNSPWSELKPSVVVLPTSRSAAVAAYPWLGYHGVWGERRSSFFNAPEGPSTRERWTKPITWADTTWRARSFAIAGGRTLGPTATSFFCGAVAKASIVLILLFAHGTAFALVLGLLVLALFWLGARTSWDVSDPSDLRRRRPWGSLITSAGRVYRGHLRLFLGIGAFLILLGIVVAGLQYLVFRLSGFSALVDAFGSSNGLTETIVLGFGLVANLLGLTLVQATCAVALVELDAGRSLTVSDAYRLTYRRLRPLLGGLLLASLVIALLDLTIIGLPIAIWLTIRWSLLAQAVALEGKSAVGGLRRSARIVRSHWWRTASFTVLVTGVALLLGPVVGTLLLVATNASFDVVNLASDVVYVFALPFVAIATTYLYFDLTARSSAEAVDAASST